MREISARYTPRFARLVSRVSSRTSSSTTSTSGSRGSSGTASSASRLLIRFFVRLFGVSHRAAWHRQHVERIVDATIATDLEVHVVVRGAAGAAHAGNALTRGDPVADRHEIFVVVRVHGGEPVFVLDLEHATVARLHARYHDHAGGGCLDRLTVRGANVDAAVPAAAAASEGRADRAGRGPLKYGQRVGEVGHREHEIDR